MTRDKALHILGLNEQASIQDIKSAYREMAQILHPDKYTHNKRLQRRAEEQFKNVQDAFRYLLKRPAPTDTADPESAFSPASSVTQGQATLAGTLAGVIAARVQLIEQRSQLYEQRTFAIVCLIVGALVAFAARRYPILGIVSVAAIGAGVVQFITSLQSLIFIKERIEVLGKQKQDLEEQLKQ